MEHIQFPQDVAITQAVAQEEPDAGDVVRISLQADIDSNFVELLAYVYYPKVQSNEAAAYEFI